MEFFGCDGSIIDLESTYAIHVGALNLFFTYSIPLFYRYGLRPEKEHYMYGTCARAGCMHAWPRESRRSIRYVVAGIRCCHRLLSLSHQQKFLRR